MKVSVLVNNYNYSAYLGECLESIACQTRLPNEVIFVDDGSSDDSVALAEAALGALPAAKLVSKKNGGQLSAFEAGIAAAEGDWLFFLDADDVYRPEHIAKVMEAVAQNPKTGMVFSQMEFFGPGADAVPYVYRQPYGDLGYATLLNLAGWGVCVTPFPATATSAVAIHRRHVESLFPFGDALNFAWRTSADVPLLRGALLNGARRFALKEQTVGYRIHGQNAFAGNKAPFEGLPGLDARSKGVICQRIGLAYDAVARLHKEYEELPTKNPYLRKFYRHAALSCDLGWDQRLKNWWRISRA